MSALNLLSKIKNTPTVYALNLLARARAYMSYEKVTKFTCKAYLRVI